jgi:tetratricopeptide (TPR) repeat protein
VKAQIEYGSALAADPDSAGAHRGLGLLFLRRGEAQKALPYLQEYLARSPQAADREYIEAYVKEHMR